MVLGVFLARSAAINVLAVSINSNHLQGGLMESLALMVSLVFLSVLFSGPISLVFCFFEMPLFCITFGLLAIGLGAFWCCVAPFPVSIIGVVSAFLGFVSLTRI